jgi:hypothetical protein
MRALLAPADSDRVGVVRQILKQRTCVFTAITKSSELL